MGARLFIIKMVLAATPILANRNSETTSITGDMTHVGSGWIGQYVSVQVLRLALGCWRIAVIPLFGALRSANA